mgnify:CR=1 FL=1
MHPQDMRNLFIFCALAILVYFIYDAYLLKPQQEAIKAARQHQITAAATMPAEEMMKPRPRAEIIAEGGRVKIEGKELAGSISLTGGRLDDITLRNFHQELDKKDNIVVLSPKGSEFSRYVDYGWVADEGSNVALPDDKTQWRVEGNDALTQGNPVTLVWNNGQGLTFSRTYAVDDHFVFTVTEKVTNKSGSEVTLYPYGLISQNGIPKDQDARSLAHSGPIGYIGRELVELPYKKIRKEPSHVVQSDKGWVAMTDKYWLASLIPAQGEQVKYRFNFTPDLASAEDDAGRYQVDFTGAAEIIKPGESAENVSHIFTGAKKVLMLEAYEKQLNVPHMDLSVDFGLFYFMTKPFFYALHWFGKITGNFGIAIIIMTLVVRMAVFPLTATSYRSFAKMKKVSPQILEIRNQYGTDKVKLQQELVKLYEREGVNPLAGCFPILVQIPIFFAFYKTLFVTIEMRHAPFFGWINDLSAPDPTSIFNLFGLMPYDVPGFLQIGVWPCLMLIVMIIQKKLNPPPQDPIQRDMMNYFPFVITYMMSHFASGLVIYWTVSGFISMLQQMFIMKQLGVPIHLFGETPEEKEMDKAIAEGPSVHPLIEMAEEDLENAVAKDITPPKPKKKKKKK